VTLDKWPDSRFWAVLDDDGDLVCLTVYKKGAKEVIRRLTEPDKQRMSKLLIKRILRVAVHACECTLNPEDCKANCDCTACKVWWEISQAVLPRAKRLS